MTEQTKDTFDQWCIVEIFGHERIAGRVTEQLIGLEFERGGQSYFIAGRQDIWSGIRLGKFPSDNIGADYPRVKVT